MINDNIVKVVKSKPGERQVSVDDQVVILITKQGRQNWCAENTAGRILMSGHPRDAVIRHSVWLAEHGRY